MKVCILGGGGFLGGYLSRALMDQKGISLRVFGSRSSGIDVGASQNGFEYMSGNFTDGELVKKALNSIDVAFHLISTTLPANSNLDPALDIQENLLSTINFLKIAIDSGVKKVIFFSSGGTVYGAPIQLPIQESHPTNPICSYGIQKLAIEKYLYFFNKMYGLDYGVLRVGNPYGLNQNLSNKQGFIQTAISKALAYSPIEIWGDGTNIRDYLHANDVALAAIKMMTYKGKYHIFNIGTGKGYSINDVLAIIEKKMGIRLLRQYSQSRFFDVKENVLDIRLAREELNWMPTITLEDHITSLVDMNSIKSPINDV